jgi:hypothetical protein
MVCSATRHTGLLLVLLVATPSIGIAQGFSQKGFAEVQGIGYPQTTAKDSTQLVGEAAPTPTSRPTGTASAGATDPSSGPAWRCGVSMRS